MGALWNIGFRILTKSVVDTATLAPQRSALATAAAVSRALSELEIEHKTKQIVRASSSKARPGDGAWTTRTGVLRNSFHSVMAADQLSGSYGSDLKRAAKVEHGGTIRSSRPGGFLAIPTKYAPKGLWPRDMGGLFFKTSSTGKPYLAEMQGGRLRAVFLLRKSVTLPPRPALDRAVEATEESRRKLFLGVVDAMVGGA